MRKRLLRSLLLLGIFLVMSMGLYSAEASAASKTYVYYGTHLSGYRKTVYNKLKKSWKKGKTSIITLESRGVSPEYAGMWVLNDHPEYFWCNTYSSGEGYGYLYFRMASWKNAVNKKSVFNRRLNKVVNSLKKKCKGKSTAQKAVILHDWICKNCKYTHTSYDQSAYGVIVKKKAVCAGFARAYKLLCDQFGIKCICVNVLLNSVPHLTNYVKVGSKWYLVDCTNDQNPAGPLRYFCLVGSRTVGSDLLSSCGVDLPPLSVEDYPLSDRPASKVMSAKADPGKYSYGTL